ncbi:MAG TPA: glycosyltransferase family 9 protein [Bacteroidales bacterium]|nr:glycosyltransferase family 9 protein [Bacteroidales bacterium]
MPDAVNISASWTELMRKGLFNEAWKLSDAFLRSGINRNYSTLPRHFQCIWDGSILKNKKVLIRCYHGLGDTIMFIRYVHLLREIASEVIVWVQPKLLELFRSVKEVDRLIPLHDGIPEVEYDVDLEIMELPHIFRTSLKTIPDEVPYLHVQPLKLKDNGLFSVGIVWQAGDWDNSRNIPFELIRTMFELDYINLIILQDKATEAGWQQGFGFHPGDCSLYEHARIIAGLDLMISVDSMPAHLAGALNTPVWLLLNCNADWRWMENRNDSPWYPSMRLFRQNNPGNWENVIEEVKNELDLLQSGLC